MESPQTYADTHAAKQEMLDTNAAKEAMFLHAERSGYEWAAASPGQKRAKSATPGWNSMTQAKQTLFDGMQTRPYTSQLSGSPKARAKSGARSLHAWQRDYNAKGIIDEKVTSLRYQKVAAMKKSALKEADRRKLAVEVVEEEMYQAQSAANKRIDTGIRKIKMSAPRRTAAYHGGEPFLFDGNENLEDDFSLKDAQDMFRGEAWELMTETLGALDEFKPPARALDYGNKGGTKKRGSFSSGVTPTELYKAMKQDKKKKEQREIGAADLTSLKKLLVRKYGTLWAAWRHGLASDGVSTLSFQSWCSAMRAIGFEGNALAVWKQLDEDSSGLVSFDEIDSEVAERMHNFKVLVWAKYGPSWDDVWRVVDDDRSNQVDPSEFEEVCDKIGYKSSSAMDLFKQLRNHPSRKFLTIQDFKAIPKTI